MSKISFTDLTIQSLKPGTYFDLKTPGFGIRVGKNRRTWIVLKGAKSDKVSIGHYPAQRLSEARRAALRELGSRHVPSTAPTFPEALEQFLALNRWRPRAKYEITRTLNRYFHWHKTLDKITHNDVGQVIDGIEAKSEAAHALKDIKTFFAWCVPRYVSFSPAQGIKSPHRYTPRTKLLTDIEIARIWKSADELGGYGRQVQLLITTGQRANQIISLKPEWIKGDTIQFPPSVMKSGTPHVIPFGPLTASLFTDVRPTSYQGKKKKELDELSGVTGYVLHDFRRYFSSTHARLKTPIDCTEAMLGHRTGSRSPIQRVYDLYDRLEDMRAAVERYELHLQSILK